MISSYFCPIVTADEQASQHEHGIDDDDGIDESLHDARCKSKRWTVQKFAKYGGNVRIAPGRVAHSETRVFHGMRHAPCY